MRWFPVTSTHTCRLTLRELLFWSWRARQKALQAFDDYAAVYESPSVVGGDCVPNEDLESRNRSCQTHG